MVIHRDLKLDNLLLKDATLREVKIADFGLSEYYRPGGTLNSHRGTLSFQAPEIFSGSNYAGPPLDVWALGVILFALLSGRLPFEGPELNSLKRPRDQIIRQKIVNCQYKLDEHISSDGKVCNLPPLTYPYVCTLSYIHIYPLLYITNDTATGHPTTYVKIRSRSTCICARIVRPQLGYRS